MSTLPNALKLCQFCALSILSMPKQPLLLVPSFENASQRLKKNSPWELCFKFALLPSQSLRLHFHSNRGPEVLASQVNILYIGQKFHLKSDPVGFKLVCLILLTCRHRLCADSWQNDARWCFQNHVLYT